VSVLYIRFHGNYTSPYTQEPYGIFVVVFHLYRDGKLSEIESREYLITKEWFEEKLPNPPYYDDNNTIRAVTWFKENESTIKMIEKLEPLINIAKKYEVVIIRSYSDQAPGKIIYEDGFQIGVIKDS
jgi:hypothetical protein